MAPPARVIDGLRTGLVPMVGFGHAFLAEDSLVVAVESVRRALSAARRANGDAPLSNKLLEAEVAVGYLPFIDAVQTVGTRDYQRRSLAERASMWLTVSGCLAGQVSPYR